MCRCHIIDFLKNQPLSHKRGSTFISIEKSTLSVAVVHVVLFVLCVFVFQSTISPSIGIYCFVALGFQGEWWAGKHHTSKYMKVQSISKSVFKRMKEVEKNPTNCIDLDDYFISRWSIKLAESLLLTVSSTPQVQMTSEKLWVTAWKIRECSCSEGSLEMKSEHFPKAASAIISSWVLSVSIHTHTVTWVLNS